MRAVVQLACHGLRTELTSPLRLNSTGLLERIPPAMAFGEATSIKDSLWKASHLIILPIASAPFSLIDFFLLSGDLGDWWAERALSTVALFGIHAPRSCSTVSQLSFGSTCVN